MRGRVGTRACAALTDEVKIKVDDDVLTISAEHEESEDEKKDNYVRRERRYGAFSRSIDLPKGVTADQVEASSKDGVVEISIPKPKQEEFKAVETTSRSCGRASTPSASLRQSRCS